MQTNTFVIRHHLLQFNKMLQANKAQLLSYLHLQSLNVRQAELQYWISVYSKLGTLGALLSGFAASILLLATNIPSVKTETLVEASISNPSSFKSVHPERIDIDTLPHLIFLLSTCAALGCNVLLVTQTTIHSVFGPGVALQGQGEKAFHRTISCFEKQFPKILRLFEYGLVFYFTSACTAVLHFYSLLKSLFIILVLGSFLWLLNKRMITLKQSFNLPRIHTGRMKSAAIQDIASVVHRSSFLNYDAYPYENLLT